MTAWQKIKLIKGVPFNEFCFATNNSHEICLNLLGSIELSVNYFYAPSFWFNVSTTSSASNP